MTKARILATTLVGVVAIDIVTKRWALGALQHGVTVPGLGDLVPLTLAFNEGAAFSLSLGGASRPVFLFLSLIALGALFALYWNTPASDRRRLFAVALVSAGAVGNLIDRIRWDRGVVDFIGPIDLGLLNWPIFNFADMAISGGAVLLALSLWREDVAQRAAAAAAAVNTDGG